LVEISAEKPLDSFWFVELRPEGGFDLTHLLDPNYRRTTCPVEDVPSNPPLSRTQCAF
jgi:hypothetical protein